MIIDAHTVLESEVLTRFSHKLIQCRRRLCGRASCSHRGSSAVERLRYSPRLGHRHSSGGFGLPTGYGHTQAVEWSACADCDAIEEREEGYAVRKIRRGRLGRLLTAGTPLEALCGLFNEARASYSLLSTFGTSKSEGRAPTS